jgi:uridine kinase
MEAVQRYLRDQGCGVIVVTRDLLGAGPDSLAEAKSIVLSSAARASEARRQERFVAELEQAAVVDAIRALPASSTRPVTLVAVDGPGGSGKTTLATALAARLEDCAVVHGDDFYRPMPDEQRERLDPGQGYHRYFDWQRLRDQVLLPLRDGRTVRYRVHDWGTGRLGATRRIDPGVGVVIVEGVYSARPELCDLYDLTVYVDTSRETCLRRARERGENPERWILLWRAAEDHSIATTRPRTRLDLVVGGDRDG